MDEQCVWPQWLNLASRGGVQRVVSLYRHRALGLLWSVPSELDGPSSFAPTHHCVATNFYKFQPSNGIFDMLNPIHQTRIYYDIRDPRRQVTYDDDWDAQKRTADREWWGQLRLVAARCKAPAPCQRPKFFTRRWVRHNMGKLTEKGLRIHLYWHPVVGHIYAISDDGLADAPVPHFDSRGNPIKPPNNTQFVAVCK